MKVVEFIVNMEKCRIIFLFRNPYHGCFSAEKNGWFTSADLSHKIFKLILTAQTPLSVLTTGSMEEAVLLLRLTGWWLDITFGTDGRQEKNSM